MTRVVVGKVHRLSAIADDEELDEAQQRACIAVAGIVLVLDDLLHRPARIDAQGLDLDLHHRDAIDQQQHIVAVVAIVGIDAKLMHDLEVVLAPVLEVHQRIGERCAVIAAEVVLLAQHAGSGEYVGRDQFVEQARELAVGEAHAIECFELLAEVGFERGPVADVGSIGVLEVAQLLDEGRLDVLFFHTKTLQLGGWRIRGLGSHWGR